MRVAVLVLLAACYSPARDQACAVTCALDTDCPGDLVCAGNRCTLSGSTCGDGGVPADAPQPDAPMIEPGCAGLPNGLLPHICLDPPAGVMITSNIATDDPACDSAMVTGACVIAGVSITIAQNISVTGSRPLVLWSASVIQITGTLDVSSHFGKQGPGAGATGGVCTALDGDQNAQMGSGGVGGTFSSAGGHGGGARVGSETVTTVNMPQLPLPIALHGGCSGGNGGLPPGGAGGIGGGAVYLMAHDLILVSGTINASGGGAQGGGSGNMAVDVGGGGGGGAGGLIAFDAPVLKLDGATLISLGGGGGGGTGIFVDPLTTQTTINEGNPGNPPTTATVGRGGLATVPTNAGGDGSPFSGALAPDGGTVDLTHSGGGGGGGGGAGFIVRYGIQTDISPPIVRPPLQSQ